MGIPDAPYNDLPGPPIDALETRSVLKATTATRAALAALDQAVQRIPNPSVLVSAIPLPEAQASSEVENIVTTTDDLFTFASGPEDEPSSEVKGFTSAGANADLLEVLFQQPYCRISDVMETCAVSRPTATKWLDELVRARKLTDARIGRERLFINYRFLRALSG